MSYLKKQIKEMESIIALESLYIKEQQANLIHHRTSSCFLSVIVLSCFTFGYFLSRGKSLPQAISRLAVLGISTRKLYHKYRPVLYFLSSKK